MEGAHRKLPAVRRDADELKMAWQLGCRSPAVPLQCLLLAQFSVLLNTLCARNSCLLFCRPFRQASDLRIFPSCPKWTGIPC